jgi:hypothetical protein
MDIGHAATQDDGIGINEIDDGGERTGETIGVPAECGGCQRLSTSKRRDDLLACCRHSGDFKVITSQTGAGNPSFLTPGLATPATWCVSHFFRRRPRQGVVPPLACDAIGPVNQFSVDDETPAASRTENHGEYGVRAVGCAINGLG